MDVVLFECLHQQSRAEVATDRPLNSWQSLGTWAWCTNIVPSHSQSTSVQTPQQSRITHKHRYTLSNTGIPSALQSCGKKMTNDVTGFVSISALLKRLSTLEQARKVSAEEIAAAVALIFTNSLSPVQFGVLLWALHTTNLDHQAEVLAACASSMRDAAAQVDEPALTEVIKRRSRQEGTYQGGLVCSFNTSECTPLRY